MLRKVGPALVVSFAVAALACGGDSHQGSSSSLPLGEPISGLVAGQWNWVGFADSSCSDGSPTGIGINPGTGPDLVFFLDGGGACSSGVTCFVLKTATLGPFGAAEFQARTASAPGSILDRGLAGNPFADATLVFVPYCTGDVHGGDRVVTYQDGPGGTVHHTGHTNVLAYLKRVAATYPSPRRLVVSGASAGGFGTMLNYGSVRGYYPMAEGFLIDDSGPPLKSNGGPLIQAGFVSWGITDALDPLCGPGVCEADLSQGLSALLRNHPGDRFALLSWSVDPTISAFYFITPSEFATELLNLTTTVIEPASNAAAFIAVGASHTMLGNPGAVSQNGVSLVTWLGEQVNGSAAWRTVKP